MTDAAEAILPYSRLVGQERLKLALELAYVAPAIGGVLVSGQRGTAKSTAVRAFSVMAYGGLPVTLPINATDDRVIGGLKLDELMQGTPKYRPGLLEEAAGSGMLYIDEVNLLDDHIVNLILDAASTGILSVQRDHIAREPVEISFTLVGTMNPEEGSLRPQLLDRFGLMTAVRSEAYRESRRRILETVVRFDEARRTEDDPWLGEGREQDRQRAIELEAARDGLYDVDASQIAPLCAQVAERFDAAGHRGDYVMAYAARAHAVLAGEAVARPEDLRAVAPMALAHRRRSAVHGGTYDWTDEDDEQLDTALSGG